LSHAAGGKLVDSILVERSLGFAVEPHFVEGFRFFLFKQPGSRLDNGLFREAVILERHEAKLVSPVAPVQNMGISPWFSPVDQRLGVGPAPSDE
jgi:hypothetical protein